MISEEIASSASSSAALGIPVNVENIAKLRKRNPRWTIFPEWQLMSEEKAIASHLDGADVIWAYVDIEEFRKYLDEYQSGNFRTGKNKLCDSKNRRTIDDEIVTSSQYVLLDVDKRTFNDTPEIVKQNAWIFYPSASVAAVINGDVPKMHFIYKAPYPIPRDYVKRYREIFLQLLTKDFPDFEYDRAVVNPRWEFYGKNPEFKDTGYIKRDDSKIIPVDLHNQILDQARIDSENLKHTLAENSSKKKTLTDRVDEYLVENSSLSAICECVFDSFEWSEKHHSHHTFEQWETKAEMFDPDAKSDNGLAIYQSDRTGRLLITHKGTNRTMNLYEFYARYQLYLDSQECIEVDVQVNGSKFKKIVGEICKKLDIEPYEFKPEFVDKETGQKLQYDDFLPQYVKCYGDRTDKSTFYYWDIEQRIWTHTLATETLIRCCVAPLIVSITGAPFEQVVPELEKLAKKVIKMKPIYAIRQPLEGDPDLIGFTNGTYRMSTRELLNDSPDHKIFHRYPYEFEVINSDINARVEAVLKKWACLHPNDWQVVRDYFWASFLKMGQEWSAGMFFYGSPGSGKSLMVKALGLVDDKAIISIQADNLSNGNYPFSEYTPSCHGMYIDDIGDANARGMNVLYELLTEGSKVPYSAKWINSMSLKRHATFAFTSENFPVSLRSQRTGMLRRAIAVEVNHGNEGFAKLEPEIRAIFLNPEAMREWFIWSIQNVDSKTLIERYRTYINDDERKQILKNAIAVDSPMVQFAESELIIGESVDDYVLTDELLERLKAYSKRTNDNYLIKLNDLMLKKQAISDIRQGHVNGQKMIDIQNIQKNAQGQPKQKRIDGQLKSVVWGIRFKSSDEIRIEIGTSAAEDDDF